jgi:hypothetical protein
MQIKSVLPVKIKLNYNHDKVGILYNTQYYAGLIITNAGQQILLPLKMDFIN